VDWIVQVVLVVDVVYVDVVVISPARGPRIDDLEPVTAVLEARAALVDFGAVEAEVVFPSKVLVEILFGDTSVIGSGASLRIMVIIRTGTIVMRLAIALLLGTALLLGLGPGVLLSLSLVLLSSVLLGLVLLGLLLLGLMLLVFTSVLLFLLGAVLVVLGAPGIFFRPLLLLLLRVIVLLGGLALRLWMLGLRMLSLRMCGFSFRALGLRMFFLTGMLFPLLGKSAGCAEG
jgi:hypothetical protein